MSSVLPARISVFAIRARLRSPTTGRKYWTLSAPICTRSVEPSLDQVRLRTFSWRKSALRRVVIPAWISSRVRVVPDGRPPVTDLVPRSWRDVTVPGLLVSWSPSGALWPVTALPTARTRSSVASVRRRARSVTFSALRFRVAWMPRTAAADTTRSPPLRGTTRSPSRLAVMAEKLVPNASTSAVWALTAWGGALSARVVAAAAGRRSAVSVPGSDAAGAPCPRSGPGGRLPLLGRPLVTGGLIA